MLFVCPGVGEVGGEVELQHGARTRQVLKHVRALMPHRQQAHVEMARIYHMAD